jgi:cardiolipin synthase
MWQYILLTIEILNIIAVAYILLDVFLENRPVSHLLSWVFVFLVIPLLGIVIFILVGRNIRKRKIYRKKEKADSRFMQKGREAASLADEAELQGNNHIKKLNQLLISNNKSFLSDQNSTEILNNGEETFNSIFECLEKASHHIHLEYYIINEGKIASQLADILIRKVSEGVKVRLIYDDFGSWGLRNKFLKKLSESGVELHAFMPVRLHHFATRINYRNHRKIIVIDGHTGFIGGLNIDDKYISGDPDLGFWRDIHFKVSGPAVGGLQHIFLNDWHFTSGERICGKEYFPDGIQGGSSLLHVVSSGPDSDWESIMQVYFYLITNAQKSICITSPYFFPNESILTAFTTASLSGTSIRLILPYRSDSRMATWGSRSYFQQLLEANIEIYLYNKGFTHSKLLIIDDEIASAGTANMDIRSFSQNFEANIIIYDKSIVRKLKDDFENDIKDCVKVDYETFAERPVKQKIAESAARLFSPLM